MRVENQRLHPGIVRPLPQQGPFATPGRSANGLSRPVERHPMPNANNTSEGSGTGAPSISSLCFIIDKDFVFRQGLAAELRRTGIDVVELSSASRLLEMVENQNPDIVLVNVDR